MASCVDTYGLLTVPRPPTVGIPVPRKTGDLRSAPWPGQETVPQHEVTSEDIAMPDSQPRNLRVVREISRPDMLFSVARLPDSERLLVAGSAGKVFALATAQGGPAPQELANHGRYVTSVRVVGDMAG